MDRSVEEKVERLDELVEIFTQALGLDDWEIDIQYGPLSTESESDVEFMQFKAETQALGHYQKATICFDLEQIPYDNLPEYVIHELVHVMNSDLEDHAEFASEGNLGSERGALRATETVASRWERAPIWALWLAEVGG